MTVWSNEPEILVVCSLRWTLRQSLAVNLCRAIILTHSSKHKEDNLKSPLDRTPNNDVEVMWINKQQLSWWTNFRCWFRAYKEFSLELFSFPSDHEAFLGIYFWILRRRCDFNVSVSGKVNQQRDIQISITLRSSNVSETLLWFILKFQTSKKTINYKSWTFVIHSKVDSVINVSRTVLAVTFIMRFTGMTCMKDRAWLNQMVKSMQWCEMQRLAK